MRIEKTEINDIDNHFSHNIMSSHPIGLNIFSLKSQRTGGFTHLKFRIYQWSKHIYVADEVGIRWHKVA